MLDISKRLLKKAYHIPDELIDIAIDAERSLSGFFTKADEIADFNHLRLLHGFQSAGITDYHMMGSTGYGYGDTGREALETVYAAFFGCEKALVRSQIMSGTHALSLGLYGLLRPGDGLISAADPLYDTLATIIGLGSRGEGVAEDTLLKSGVSYSEIPLKWQPGDAVGYDEGAVIDVERLIDAIQPETKMIFLQRSRGYDWRPALSIAELKRVISRVKEKREDLICLVDNCYCEMTDTLEPGAVGADLVIGSLIKNPGGTLAPCGGYIVGKKAYVDTCASRLLAPGLRSDMGASLGFTRPALQGLFQAPYTVAQAVKGAALAGEVFHRLGYEVLPRANVIGSPFDRVDVVQSIRLGSEEKLIRFCQAIQRACPIDSMYRPEPSVLPGYDHEVIMAGGSFIQGSSSELSADGPLRPPYIAYLQGGFSLAQIRLGILLAADAVGRA